MKIVCLGGGPSGVYLAISMKLQNPEHQIEVYERNRADDTFGWGVVFSDQTMENLKTNDPVSAENMIGELIHWDDIDVHIRGEVIKSGGHGFIGIGRQRLLDILYDRALELGVKFHFETEFELEDLTTRFADADLIVAADGLNSKVRNNNLEAFDCDIDMRPNKFVWLGTHQRFDDAFTFIFEKTEHGWIWVHAYQFDNETSTFIVECGPETYDAWGFEHMDHEESAETCRKIFEKYLGGHDLMTKSAHIRGSAWINFPRVLCHTWVKDNIVLIGDAAHTAHFSIGSGTKLGFEDAISLAKHLNSGQDVREALVSYQDERELEALKLQSAARNSMSWFEELDRYLDFDPTQFTYSLLTRSQRVSHENLRLRDGKWLEGVEKWFADRAYKAVGKEKPAGRVPPMFTPYKIRNMELANRVVVSPMSMYSAKDGLINDFHFIHYGARAMGGAGLLFTEMTDISADGRITPGCAGIYTDEQMQAWKRVVDFVHGNSQAKIAMQLAHAGRKGSTKVGWEGYDMPLDEGNWELIAPSAIAWDDKNQVPREMARDDMDRVRDDFVAAVKRADQAGFDMIEMHAGHGYLLSSFITPVSNKRTDDYGGPLENRLRFPLEVFNAMRAAWPADKPMSVRISSTDWVGEDGVTPEEAVLISKAFVEAGADIIDVSTGQTLPVHKVNPVFGRMFQTPMADQIRNEGHVSTMAVGNIFETDHVNSILAAGRADLVMIGRPHLMDPQWTIRSAAEQEYHGPAVQVPKQYLTAFTQLETNLKRAAEMALNA
ncbi:bifunctional salicylyl-CoA 5-hydroxylase/oxidoreductase [Emcibacter sp.]|uniref:bifunctional salicylyl-CoA 5-hydroxylase/oxidoreductase n=1 Tax=Emcibacter sp. TaxID=1979954 RepID=UPI002AA6A01B|nr:bifunctional salicylyl-CoA 5-hydroxylase/oxidoreductase [Emcibacter sp.]